MDSKIEELDRVLAQYATEIKKSIAAAKPEPLDLSKLPAPQVNVAAPVIPPIVVPPFPEIPKFPDIHVPTPQVTVNVDHVTVDNLPEPQQFPESILISNPEAIVAPLKKSLTDLLNAQSRGSGQTAQYKSGDSYSASVGAFGVAALWEDTGNVMRTVSASKPLPVTGTLSQGTAAANSGAWPIRIIDSDNTDNSLSTGGQIGQKVQIVGDGDKFVRGIVQQGASTSQVQPVLVSTNSPTNTNAALISDTDGNLEERVAATKTILLDSNSTLFAAGGSYTGSWKSVMGKYSAMIVASMVNVGGFGGSTRYAQVQVQFSSDGVNFNGAYINLNVGYTDSNPTNVSVPILDNYARLYIAEQGGYSWAAAGGTHRTTLVGNPVGSGSFVRTVGSTSVIGDADVTNPGVIIAGVESVSGTSALSIAVDNNGVGLGIINAVGKSTTFTGTALVTANKLASSSTNATVGVAATSTQVFATATARIGISVYNDGGQIVYLKKGTGCSTTSFDWILQPYDLLYIPHGIGYYGVIHHIAAAASGNLRVSSW